MSHAPKWDLLKRDMESLTEGESRSTGLMTCDVRSQTKTARVYVGSPRKTHLPHTFVEKDSDTQWYCMFRCKA